MKTMHRILLLSDTHGNLDLINRFAAEYHADLCIHCGDVGFFTAQSVLQLPHAELTRMVRHSALSAERKEFLLALEPQKLTQEVISERLAGNFEDYLAGAKRFDIPVYAVWGNHEDVKIIEQLQHTPVENFTLLHETNPVVIDKVRFYGLGGDFNEKHLTMSEKGGIPVVKHQIKSSFFQYAKLCRTLDGLPQEETRIQITHVSPIENPFIELVANHCRASLTLSGHMHRNEHQFFNGRTAGELDVYYSELKKRFPRLPWKILQPQGTSKSAKHINLAAQKPLVIEIDNGNWQIIS